VSDVTIDQLIRHCRNMGIAVRGAFHLNPGEFQHLQPTAGTVVLLGFTSSIQWPIFAASAEAADGLPDPLDRWSRRVIGGLGREFDARAIYPSEAPIVPFQQLARRCEPVHTSPIGLLIHSQWGLWHAYRGALVFGQRLPLPERTLTVSPCDACQGKPCLSTCPVDAFGQGGFNLERCAQHVSSEAGSECRERGCRARRACPVGARYQYAPEQARFHMAAFLKAVQ
jgi:hypothetical protein